MLGPFVQNRMRQWNFVDNVSWQLGKHSLKFGLDYRYLFPKAAPRDYTMNIALNNAAYLLVGDKACPAPCASNVSTWANDSVTGIYKT